MDARQTVDLSEDFRRSVMNDVVRSIEDAEVGFTARPRPWMRITVVANDGNTITVEEQIIELKQQWEYGVDENGPYRSRVEKELPIGTPTAYTTPKSALWKYFEHMPDVYSMRP